MRIKDQPDMLESRTRQCLQMERKWADPRQRIANLVYIYYNIRDPHGVNVQVCQKAFCSIHGFGPKRLQVLRRKMEESCGSSVEPDKRGKHSDVLLVKN